MNINKQIKEGTLDEVSKKRVENNLCLACGTALPPKAEGARKSSRFCSKSCYNRYLYNNNESYQLQRRTYAYNYYMKHKSEPEYKEKQKVKWKQWVVDNKEHFNALMRIYNKKRSYRVYHERQNAGMCVYCGKVRPELGRIGCIPCVDIKNVLAKEYYIKNRERLRYREKEYLKKNYSKIKAAKKEWRTKNQDKINAYMRKRYARTKAINPETVARDGARRVKGEDAKHAVDTDYTTITQSFFT
jgi:ribosomal protein L40E